MKDEYDDLFPDTQDADGEGEEESTVWSGIFPSGRTATAAKLAVAGGLAALAFALGRWERPAGRQIDPSAEERSRFLAIQSERQATMTRIASVESMIRELRTPNPPYGDFLAGLGRAVPPEIGLDRVAVRNSEFLVRGHLIEPTPDPQGGPLRELLRNLQSPGAPWRLSAPGGGEARSGDRYFAIRGELLADAFAPAAGISPPSGLALSDATPEAAARADEQLEAELVRLPAAAGFERRVANWNSNWTVQAAPVEHTPEIRVRHYTLNSRDRALSAWPALVERIRSLGEEPGVVLDSLELLAAPDGPEVFSGAEIGLTARLRP